MITAKRSELAVVVFVVVVVAWWAIRIFLEYAQGAGRAVTHLLLVILEEGWAADHCVDGHEAEQDVEGDSWSCHYDVMRRSAQHAQLSCIWLERVYGRDADRWEEGVWACDYHRNDYAEHHDVTTVEKSYECRVELSSEEQDLHGLARRVILSIEWVNPPWLRKEIQDWAIFVTVVDGAGVHSRVLFVLILVISTRLFYLVAACVSIEHVHNG